VIVAPEERVVPIRPEPPDRDFAGLRDVALDAVRRQVDLTAPHAWTDHNVHDPGVTLLEAILWAIADCHYRSAERSFEGWAAEADSWRPAPVPRGRDNRVEAARVLREKGAEARRLVAESGSRGAAAERVRAELCSNPAEHAGAARAVVAQVREPLLLRAALDHSGAAAAELVSLGLWPEELADLATHERRRSFVALLNERGDELRAAADATLDPVGAVASAFALDQVQAEIAVAAHPCPRVGPGFWESNGRTQLWPPHPLQARTCEPVTGEDYRRLASAASGVRRAWVAPGTAAGVRWNGDPQTQAAPERQGALTLLVERDPAAQPMSDPMFLRACLSSALGAPGEQSEVDLWVAPAVGDPAPLDFRDNRGWLSPRRLLGDEVGAALVDRCGVVVKGVLAIEATTSARAVLDEAERLLADFISPTRKHPEEPDPPPPEPLRCPEELEGPWPRLLGGLAAPWPAAPPPAGGWQPGEPVRVSEVVQLLETIPEVLGVDGLELQSADGGDWQKESLAIDPFCLPGFERHCLVAHVLQPRRCDA
jgi:hypothetical protein